MAAAGGAWVMPGQGADRASERRVPGDRWRGASPLPDRWCVMDGDFDGLLSAAVSMVEALTEAREVAAARLSPPGGGPVSGGEFAARALVARLDEAIALTVDAAAATVLAAQVADLAAGGSYPDGHGVPYEGAGALVWDAREALVNPAGVRRVG